MVRCLTSFGMTVDIVSFDKNLLTTAVDFCIFASSLVKNEDESLETRGQRPIKFVRNSGYGAEFLKKENQKILFFIYGHSKDGKSSWKIFSSTHHFV